MIYFTKKQTAKTERTEAMSFIMLTLLIYLGTYTQVLEQPLRPDLAQTQEDSYYSELIKAIEEESLYEMDEEELNKQVAISALLALGDEYSDVRSLDEEEFSDFDMGSYADLGLVIDSVDYNGNSELRIINVLSGSGAKRAGLEAGDIILEVNGVRTKGSYDIYDGAVALKPSKEAIEFKIERNSKALEIKAMALPYTEPVLEDRVINGDIYYLDINYFDWDTAEKIKAQIEKFNSYKFDKLILDLRGNLGGDIDAAVDAASFFFDDEIICYFKRKSGTEEVRRREKSLALDKKIVILISENTASSSELFAKLLREKAGATLVGRQSFGKDIGQEFFEMNGLEIKLTTLAISTNKNEFMKHEGLVPDLIIEEPLFSDRGDEVLIRGLEQFQ